MNYIKLTSENIESEHICCAFSDKKCTEGYALKKAWLKNAFTEDYIFERLDERAKVFIEYGPAETTWQPVAAPGYLALGCFWVSGKYKKCGHGKALLQSAIKAAKAQDKAGIIAVVGSKKFHFMSDTRWLQRQGFEVCDTTESGFSLLALTLDKHASLAHFLPVAKAGTCPDKGLTVYYSNRCPYTEYHVQNSLKESAAKRNLPLTVHKLESLKEAQNCPSPATIFSLFLDGRFITTDISACMDSRFDKLVGT